MTQKYANNFFRIQLKATHWVISFCMNLYDYLQLKFDRLTRKLQSMRYQFVDGCRSVFIYVNQSIVLCSWTSYFNIITLALTHQSSSAHSTSWSIKYFTERYGLSMRSLSPAQTATELFRFFINRAFGQIFNTTRKLCYRKDDRAMRAI